MLQQSALALLAGSGAVIVAVNDLWEHLAGAKAPVGVPLSEAFPEPEYSPLRQLIGETYRTREMRTLEYPDGKGRFTTYPWTFPDGTLGVATLFAPGASAGPLPPAPGTPAPVRESSPEPSGLQGAA